MTWQILVRPVFLKDLAGLPTKVRKRVEKFAFEELPNADQPLHLGKLAKLKGYDDFYKVRFGNYRIGLRLDGQRKEAHLLRVMHRRDIYRHFP